MGINESMWMLEMKKNIASIFYPPQGVYKDNYIINIMYEAKVPNGSESLDEAWKKIEPAFNKWVVSKFFRDEMPREWKKYIHSDADLYAIWLYHFLQDAKGYCSYYNMPEILSFEPESKYTEFGKEYYKVYLAVAIHTNRIGYLKDWAVKDIENEVNYYVFDKK